MQIFDFISFWSRKLPFIDIREVEIGSNAAVDWANYIRDVCGL